VTVESWNHDAPPGFQGLHPDIPVTFYTARDEVCPFGWNEVPAGQPHWSTEAR
jgi:hypothetical protein